jgi:L-2-hydroxyglutarate oxidase
MQEISDYLIVGAGIVGLTIAREIKVRNPSAQIRILEKEPRLGVHASGRNSGVLHTGIYYLPGTLKAKLCKDGADSMFAYAQDCGIPVRRDGKVIVATSEENAKGIDQLLRNAAANQINAVKLSPQEILEIEPHACAEYGGIYCKDTAVIDSPQVVETLRSELLAQGVRIECDQMAIHIDEDKKQVKTPNHTYAYDFLINAAGSYADVVAKLVGVGQQYQLVPFKGLYYKLAPEMAGRVRGSIYPVPNPALPFLGIHFTRVISGDVYIGPTAIPALGRENYGILEGAKLTEAIAIGIQLMRLYVSNAQNFRGLVHTELPHYTKSGFMKSARKLVDKLDPGWIKSTPKVGIRPQLINTRGGKLEMDFLIENGKNSIHVLNSISPAFTSSFAFAKLVVDKIVQQKN